MAKAYAQLQLEEEFPNLRVLDHPLIKHMISMLRSRETDSKRFAELVETITILLTYEVLSAEATSPYNVWTPLEQTTGYNIREERFTLVHILRAGQGMLSGARKVMPYMSVGHIGMERDHKTLKPRSYYFNVPFHSDSQVFVIADPMLGTGGSISAAITLLKKGGAKDIRVMSIIAAPEGIERVFADHPDVRICIAALDRELNDKGYILPGLGDAGDRLFGTK